MKQIRVTSPFLDTTCSNLRREVGDTLFVTNERAAHLVSGQLCEYVADEEEAKNSEQANQPADNCSTATEAPAEEEQQPKEEGKAAKTKKTTKTSKKK